MDNNLLKSAWRHISTEDKSSDQLKKIIRERGNSLVGKIRRQLLVETIGATIFLIVYYDFFDGDKKPLLANASLVAALLFLISHNVIVYFQIRSAAKGQNIGELLGSHLLKIKMYAIASGILRLLVACSFLLFFTSAIKFTQVKYWILSGAILFFLVQMVVFMKMWKHRVDRMREIIRSLTS